MFNNLSKVRFFSLFIIFFSIILATACNMSDDKSENTANSEQTADTKGSSDTDPVVSKEDVKEIKDKLKKELKDKIHNELNSKQ